ncbi:MAG: ABC transporter permease, partial [Gammaproteobacteria bacterium]
LMIAVSATVGTDLMIGSFRETVSRWIETSLRADLYVALPGERGGASKYAADREIMSQIAALPGVRMLSSVLRTRLVGETGLENVTVFELNEKSKPGFIFREKSEGDVWARFEGGDALIVTEAYAYHRSVGVGGSVLLQTAAGMRPFEVVGVYADYSGDRGHLAMSRKTFGEYWRDLGYTGIGVYARSGADLVRLEEQIKERLSGSQTVRSDRAIYRASMEVFEQTFAVTETLRWLAAGIAFAGVFSALMALQFERIRQMGVLRALGVTSGQLGAMIASETGLIGLAAGIVACPVGYVVAHQLIFVIYRRAFGWTLDFYLSQGVFFQGVALAFCAALLAGVFPALKMANTRPAWAMRME